MRKSYNHVIAEPKHRCRSQYLFTLVAICRNNKAAPAWVCAKSRHSVACPSICACCFRFSTCEYFIYLNSAKKMCLQINYLEAFIAGNRQTIMRLCGSSQRDNMVDANKFGIRAIRVCLHCTHEDILKSNRLHLPLAFARLSSRRVSRLRFMFAKQLLEAESAVFCLCIVFSQSIKS